MGFTVNHYISTLHPSILTFHYSCFSSYLSIYQPFCLSINISFFLFLVQFQSKLQALVLLQNTSVWISLTRTQYLFSVCFSFAVKFTYNKMHLSNPYVTIFLFLLYYLQILVQFVIVAVEVGSDIILTLILVVLLIILYH